MPLRYSTKVPLVSSYTPHDGNVKLRNVTKDELDERFILVLADPVDERLARELLTQAVSRQAIFAKAIVKLIEVSSAATHNSVRQGAGAAHRFC